MKKKSCKADWQLIVIADFYQEKHELKKKKAASILGAIGCH